MGIMSDAHIDSLDLNLLRVLDMLLEERSATRAAARLGMTQSAVSHALGRLRDVVGDPLLVRSGHGLAPTPRGAALQEPVRAALASLRAALQPEAFDPAHARGAFALGTADYAVHVLGAGMQALLERRAPGVDLYVRPVPADLGPGLARGEVDLVVGAWGPNEPVPDGVVRRRLFDERFVCLLRRGHPAAEPWSLDTYTSMRHLQIAPRGTPGGPVDDVLARLGRRRRVVMTVPTFLVAPAVVATSDVVLTVPARVGLPFAAALDLEVRPVPFELPGFTISMAWHTRQHADPAQRWFRELVREAAGAGG